MALPSPLLMKPRRLGVACVALLLLCAAALATSGPANAAPSATSVCAPSTSALLAVQQAELTATPANAGAELGYSVAISGDIAVVGAPGDKVGANRSQGAAYVFVRSGATWTQQARLTAADGAEGDEFGTSVAISGDTVVVGASFATVGTNTYQGAAYVFVRSGATWTQQAKLTAGDGGGGDQFGTSVAISGDTAVVGAPGHGGGASSGAAYVFVCDATSWSQQAELTVDDGSGNDQFGSAVAISGDTAVVGANLETVGSNPEQGAAYVFVRSGTTWSQQAKLTDEDGASSDQFGYSVAIYGDTAVVGALATTVGTTEDEGAAYVFVRSGTTWSQQAQLSAADGQSDDWFGCSVGISGDTVVVGAVMDGVGTNFEQGSAYLYLDNGTTWSQQAKLTASNGAQWDRFGSVAISADTVAAGDLDRSQGGAYIFTLNKPAITSLYPGDAVPAAAVTISGRNFGASQDTSTVTFGGAVATVSSWSDTAIQCSVPAGLASGEADVVVATSQASSDAQPFTVDDAVPGQPIVSSITPPHALGGAAVTIAGLGFGDTQGTSTVTFAGTTATVSSWSDGAISCTVPLGLAPGLVDVVVHATLDSNAAGFTIDCPPPKPSISKISPAKGKVGTIVTIVGKNFGAKRGASKVLFTSKAVTKYVSWSATKIRVRVPTMSKGRKALHVVTTAGKSGVKYFTRV